MTDFSKMSDDELRAIANLPPAGASTPPLQASTSPQPMSSPPSATTPDFSKMSDDDLRAIAGAPAKQPAQDRSFVGNVAAGLDEEVKNIGRGIGQRLRSTIETIAPPQASVPGAQPTSFADTLSLPTQDDVDQARRDAAPLMNTAGGQVGSFVGRALPAIAATALPGGKKLAGSVIAGGASGLVAPTGTGESVADNVVGGAVGGGIGFGAGAGIAAVAKRSAANNATKATMNASRDGIAATARDAGYTLPPTQTSPGIVNSALEGLAGKISTAQKASIDNQTVTNRLAAQTIGLSPDQPITKDALSQIRATAGKEYDRLGNIGPIPTDAQFATDVANLRKTNDLLAQNFPGAIEIPAITKLAEALNQNQFDSAATVEALKTLRFQGQANKLAMDPGTKALGQGQIGAATALESLMERRLTQTGQTDLLDSFRNARKTIAQAYSIEKALNDSTGAVNASVLAKQLDKGKPLSGGLRTIAEVGKAFPKASQEVRDSVPGVSPLDYAVGLTATTGGPLTIAALAARPLVRSMILSKPYQNMMGVQKYGDSAILKAASSQPARVGMQAAGTVAGQPEEEDKPVQGFANGGLIRAQKDNYLAQQRQAFIDQRNASLADQTQQTIDTNAAQVAETEQLGMEIQAQNDFDQGQSLIRDTAKELGISKETGPMQIASDSEIGQRLSKAAGLIGGDQNAFAPPKPTNALTGGIGLSGSAGFSGKIGLSEKPTFSSSSRFSSDTSFSGSVKPFSTLNGLNKSAFADGGVIGAPQNVDEAILMAVNGGSDDVQAEGLTVPQHVVDALGTKFFTRLIEQFQAPA